MPASFLARHRTICAVLEELREVDKAIDPVRHARLIDEAKDYAQRMSAKLMQYKEKENADKDTSD